MDLKREKIGLADTIQHISGEGGCRIVRQMRRKSHTRIKTGGEILDVGYGG